MEEDISKQSPKIYRESLKNPKIKNSQETQTIPAVPSTTDESKNGNFFKGPFKIYENFMSLRGKLGNQTNQHKTLPNSESSEEESLEINPIPKPKIENSNDNRAESSSGDSSTDDSGIDSIVNTGNAGASSNGIRTGANAGDVWKRSEFSPFSPAEQGSMKIAKKNSTQRKNEELSKRGSLSKNNSIKRKMNTEEKPLSQLSQMISETSELLSRNSHLRASLTISMRKSNGDREQATIVIPTPKQARRALQQNSTKKVKKSVRIHDIVVDIDNIDSPGTKLNDTPEDVSKIEVELPENNSEKSETKSENTERNSEITLDENPSPFQRYNPARKPVGNNTGGNTNNTVRRSMRLAPKTVANLVSKFNPDENGPNNNSSVRPKTTSSQVKSNKDQNNNLYSKKVFKKDISTIISALNKLDEDAAKDTAVLRRSLRRAAIKAAREGLPTPPPPPKTGFRRISKTENESSKIENESSKTESSKTGNDQTSKTENDQTSKTENLKPENNQTSKKENSEKFETEVQKKEKEQNLKLATAKNEESIEEKQKMKMKGQGVLDSVTKQHLETMTKNHRNDEETLDEDENIDLGDSDRESFIRDEEVDNNPTGHRLHQHQDGQAGHGLHQHQDGQGPSSLVVTAQPAVSVLDEADDFYDDDEDDNLSAIYDEISSRAATLDRSGKFRGNLSESRGLFASIAGSILNLAATKFDDNAYSEIGVNKDQGPPPPSLLSTSRNTNTNNGDEEDLLAYTLAKLSEASNPELLKQQKSFVRNGSQRESVITSYSSSYGGRSNKSTSDDQWVDMEETTDTEHYEESPFKPNMVNVGGASSAISNGFGLSEGGFARTSLRLSSKSRGRWQNRSGRHLAGKQWTQAMKEVARSKGQTNIHAIKTIPHHRSVNISKTPSPSTNLGSSPSESPVFNEYLGKMRKELKQNT